MTRRALASRLAVMAALVGGAAASCLSGTFSLHAPAAALQLSDASFRTSGSVADAAVTVLSDRDRSIRAWFILSRPDEKAPWEHFEHISEIQEVTVSAGAPRVLIWLESLALQEGLYQPSIWLHELRDGEWVHLAGGNFSLPPVVVRGLHAPLQQFLGAAAASVRLDGLGSAGNRLDARLRVRRHDDYSQLTFSWELRPADDRDAAPVYRGRSRALSFALGDSAEVTIEEDVALPPGRYDLWASVGGGADVRGPQLVRVSDAVVVEESPGFLRRTAPAGRYRWRPTTPPSLQPSTDLNRGVGNAIALTAGPSGPTTRTCAAYWELMLPGAIRVASGSAGNCEEPRVLVPEEIDPGEYELLLKAYEHGETPGSALLSDEVLVHVEIGN